MIAVKEAKNQFKNGQVLTDHEADKEINEWLKKLYGHYGHKMIVKIFFNIGTKEINQNFIVLS